MNALTPVANAFRVLASVFLSQFRPSPMRSRFEGEPERDRLERPLRASSRTRWIQSDIETAVLLADQGDLSMAASIWRSQRRDATFAGLLSTRCGGLTRLPKKFRGSPEAIAELDARDDVGLFDAIYSPKELELFAADGAGLGVAVGEHLYLNGPQKPPTFVRLDPEWLRYRWSDDTWYYLTTGGPVHVNPGDGRWLLHTPGGFVSPWQSALWPSLGRAYIAKEHAYLHRENFSGKLAHPARVAINPQGATEDQKQSFFRKVMAWGLNTVFGLPPGWDVKLLESNGRGYEVFAQTIEDADKEFMVGIAGQIVTVTGGAGFANADIHATIRSDLIQGDAIALAKTINEQGLRPLVNRFFGGAARAFVEWDTTPPADLSAEARAMSDASKAIDDANKVLAAYGMRVDAVEMTTRFKIPTFPLAISSERFSEDAPLDDGAAEALASKMTEFSVARCEHGASNRCRLCGVERVRDFEVGADGSQMWRVLWRPIPKPAVRPDLKLLPGGAS